MTFHNKTILIACSDKKDRLQFFNYFDELDADKIFTASDLSQMEQMLNSEDDYAVLVFEISKDWVQSNQKIMRLKEAHPALKLVGLVSPQIGLKQQQFQEINAQVNDLLFSPVMQHELVAKNVAFEHLEITSQNTITPRDELELFLSQIFQPSGLSQMLIDVNSHQISHINDALKNVFAVKEADLEGKVWYETVMVNPGSDILHLKSELTEKGLLNVNLNVDFGKGAKAVKLYINYTTIADTPVYLAELHDKTEQLYQAKYLRYLELVTALNFDDKTHLDKMKSLLRWARVDFCFIIGKNRADEYKKIQWDASLNNYAQKFITASHEFLLRKVNHEETYGVDEGAYKAIPGDDFLNFYSVDSFIVCDSFVDDKNDAVLIAGCIQKNKKWKSLKLLFKQLSMHYKQSMAFKVLKHSHESESQYDVLTNLLNRRYIVKAIEQSIEKSDEFKAVMFLDLDRFKVINDSLGHDVGDDVLINVAKILKKHVNGYGVASRYAGDEFLILLNSQVDKEKTIQIANDILKSIANPIKLNNGSEINLTVSLGISFYPDHGQGVNKLIKHADIALYDAKLNGKNRFTIYQTDLDGDHTKQNEEMVKNLQNAINNDEIDVYYQPKINANTEDIMGFEALVRWEHPDLGIISPGLFIPLAEQSELINDIGMLVIEKSCVMLKKWQDEFNIPLNMSVNLSPVQLNDKLLTEKIAEVINNTGIYPSNLDFEITESEKFKSVKDALLMFKKIVNLGCTLSIDDFGTGHSTLDYLRKIPAKTLKIDQVFVKNIGLSPDDEAILDATIDMAKRVGHDIVAEGVETEEQRLYLTQKGCDYFQGYLFCRPLPAKEIHRILQQRAEILKNN
ncbi:bifunctional diguanylate cyclase/phosphodiesterase [Marinicella sp. S1101]|uniref:putative bifunctional diguanylate cyclase/phosphodiesterase n=1 Tax=Marinicella marina TaxID=2996016 RepID=UPI002260D0FE|nr:bifunctional diguanylate cyclase/phosphodiesterase [Marinicella marina]MCX7555023.1 bifunctional diguanylate cyclase/phosphodiesterase [Marinicella marina]MDJ1141313.1 bifunctional diguanylate cyclase/phosphodiesterase [Marinicella marina]